MRFYLNTSAFSRPFDDLSVPRVRHEAEAVTQLLAAVETGRAQLVSSEYLLFEVRQNPDSERARKVMVLLRAARIVVQTSPAVASRARELERFGLRGLDALHVASAEAGRAEMLVTVDERMIRRARRAANLRVRVVTPIEALAALE